MSQSYVSGDAIWDPKDGVPQHPVKITSGCALLAVLGAYQYPTTPLGLVTPGRIAYPRLTITVGSDFVDVPRVGLVAITPVLLEKADYSKPVGNGENIDELLQMAVWQSLTLEQRVPQILAALAGDEGKTIDCNQLQLSWVTGARRETVSTVLTKLMDADLIQTRYRRIRILSLEGLRQAG